MRIAVDIDGVLGNQVEAALKEIRATYSVDMEYEDVQSWDEPIPGTDTDIATAIERAERKEEYLLEMSLFDGASDVLPALASDHEIAIVTSRPPHTEESTKEWVKETGLPFDEIRFSHGGKKVNGTADLLIDDHPEELLAFADHGRNGILFDRPWNDEDRIRCADSIDVVNSWSEVPQTITTLADRSSRGQRTGK